MTSSIRPREKVSRPGSPDAASTDVNVKRRRCAMVSPLPFLLDVFTINISMDVILSSDTPDVMPFPITVFVFPRIIRQTRRGSPEAQLIRCNKAELRVHCFVRRAQSGLVEHLWFVSMKE